MKLSMSLLSLVVVVALTMKGTWGQEWLEKWVKNRDNGNIKRATGDSQPSGVLEMLGYGTFNRRSKRSVGVEHKADSKDETTTISNVVTTESDVTKTTESDVTKRSGSDVSTMSESEKAEALGRWRLMCPVLRASADVTESDPASGLSPLAFQAVFTIADKNKDGRISAQELDLYEKLIEAYEICGMLE